MWTGIRSKVKLSRVLKTLIVEDVRFLGLILERIFRPYGKSDFADNGAEAIDMYTRAFARGKPYDLVCLDILLPKMDGYEVLKHIRSFEDESSMESHDRSKIIMISALNDEKTVTKALRAGCDAYLSKPYSRKKLLEVLDQLKLIELPKDIEEEEEAQKPEQDANISEPGQEQSDEDETASS